MSSRTALSPVMSSPGRPRAERGGKPEPAMIIAPALPCPAALESVLRIAAMPAVPAVTAGTPIGAATAGCARCGGGGLEEAAERSGDELSSREFTGSDDFLNHERRGNRAEHNPERGHSHAEARLQRVELRGRIEKSDGLVGHEIQDSLGDERRDCPAERPEQHARDVHQVTTADGAQRTDCHESDEQRRERVGAEEDEFLDDVSPKQEQ